MPRCAIARPHGVGWALSTLPAAGRLPARLWRVPVMTPWVCVQRAKQALALDHFPYTTKAALCAFPACSRQAEHSRTSSRAHGSGHPWSQSNPNTAPQSTDAGCRPDAASCRARGPVHAACGEHHAGELSSPHRPAVACSSPRWCCVNRPRAYTKRSSASHSSPDAGCGSGPPPACRRQGRITSSTGARRCDTWAKRLSISPSRPSSSYRLI